MSGNYRWEYNTKVSYCTTCTNGSKPTAKVVKPMMSACPRPTEAGSPTGPSETDRARGLLIASLAHLSFPLFSLHINASRTQYSAVGYGRYKYQVFKRLFVVRTVCTPYLPSHSVPCCFSLTLILLN